MSRIFIQSPLDRLYYPIAKRPDIVCARQKIPIFTKFAHGKRLDNPYICTAVSAVLQTNKVS